MTKQTIEVEVPEGWKVKEYRMPNKGDYFWYQNRVCVASSSFIDQRLIIEKIQPRRIVVLVETGEVRRPNIGEYIQTNGNYCKCYKPERWGSEHEIWREVKDTE